MATVTKGKTFINGELVTPAALHQMVDLATVTGIANADIAANAAIADTKLAQISTAGKVLPAAVQGTAVITTDSRLSDARTPTSHTHDDRYYTETEIDTKLSGLPVSGHTHDDRYYTETEVNTLLAGKQAAGSYAPATGIAPSAITGTAVITTDSRLSDARTPTTHTHDDRYYTETEIDTKLSGLPVSGHTHDDRYYTESEMNTLLAGKQASGSYAPATGIAPSAITGTAVITTDSRLSDARTPTTHTHDASAINAGTLAIARIPTGATETTVCIGNDSRLSDARTPVDASVTTAKLAAATQMSLVPTGAIMPFAMNTEPTGWLAANGTEYSKTGAYAALFAVIGTTYGESNGAGGTGTTHFRVPDLRGYFVRGFGTNLDTTASGSFGVKQADSVGPHTHGYDDYYQTSALTVDSVSNTSAQGASPRVIGVSITETGANADRTTKSQNPTGTTETRPDNIAMLYCIKF
jgi:microcystin-dependent protein/predicted phosphodiesterase